MDKPGYINAGGILLDLKVPKVMGILNITPDSFYTGSRYNSEEEILKAAGKMIQDGADIIDVGGYSSRPGAAEISVEEEGRRVLAAIKLIAHEFPGTVISVDTFRAEIAAEAVERCGAQMINDISGGDADAEMFNLVQKLNVPYIIMHMRGDPRTMQDNPVYDDVVADILKWFGERIFRLRSAGVKDIIIDPGFGFGKTISHNFDLLNRLGDFSVAGLPLLIGVSRKSMIWKTLDITADEALAGTTVLNTIALLKGADIIRVHDVREAVQAVRLFCRMKEKGNVSN
ncbi:MAG: dihydropteroate synthase [Bacteroidetes bacterium GWE2_41_25]|nr:MAG: dihydropteroate synthase [Bacteroidetes bacterium GWA2_40_15]OFX85844.1 MAG: dihydropteroate synthase [Bacteroidetes bacterium GWC2_40_22]OFX97445.1 MAG: dihydropteroate synthase [Bacteroidetes bacterium GWE2_41_25]OFY58661.1 MAG: dihydropteroate synthase [Bacteroidetes bacterium GWF2_41_9]